MTKNERVGEVFAYLKENRKVLNQSDFAKLLGKERSYISELLNEKREVSEQFAESICVLFTDINSKWITDGVGEMINSQGLNLASQKSISDNFGMVSMPADVWAVISNQAESLKMKDEQINEVLASLKSKDRQVEEVIDLLKEQLKKGRDATTRPRAANLVVEEDE